MMSRCCRTAFRGLFASVLCAGALHASEPPADATLQLLPREVRLSGSDPSQQLVAEWVVAGQYVGDSGPDASFTSLQPEIATVSPTGLITLVKDGSATIRVTAHGRTAELNVTVTGAGNKEGWSFRHDVQTVLTKAGCNMGACHGAEAGKNGFKLTLRGYDHEADHQALVRQAKGRRVNARRPEESLLLQKAVGSIPHGGGIRFSPESLEYRILREWIAAGAPGPQATDATVVSLEVLPGLSALKVGETQQLLVTARYTDGRLRDVTRWAKYTSSEIGVATVDDNGRVTIVGNGEAAVTVWFASRVANAALSVAYPNDVSPQVFAAAPRRNLIDEHVLSKLQTLRLPPSPTASDSEFVRRAFLDCTGTLPSADEARAFLADSSADKRERLIESLLQRPEYVDYWTYKWSDVLLVSSKRLREPAVWAFSSWIRQAVASNLPWDEFARQLVTATGSTLDNGAANYFVLHKDPKLLTEATTVTFLGLSINCAQCHDHPLERWTLDDYYAMANLFGRVRLKDTGSDGEMIVYPASDGDILHPTRGVPPLPRPLDGIALPLDDPRDRRAHLAEWLTAPENPYFARAIVNRVWANFMGRGLVEMVDDLRATNPASNEPLLSALAADFVQHNYDVQHLIRLVMNSAAYQRSAAAIPGNEKDDRFHSRRFARRMSAEVLLDALSTVAAVPTDFPNYPRGTRALQLPDNNVASYFLSAFGRPAREFTCSCERTEEPNVTQTLHLVNGETLNNKLKAAGGLVDKWLQAQTQDSAVIDELYMSALSRPATEAETVSFLAVLSETTATPETDADRAARRSALEDLCWAVLSSREFLFVH